MSTEKHIVFCTDMSDDTGMCEQHEFWDDNLQIQLEDLQDKWLVALGY